MADLRLLLATIMVAVFCVFQSESVPVYRELAPSQLAPSLRFYYPFVPLSDTEIDIGHLSRSSDDFDSKPSRVMSYAPNIPSYYFRSLRSPLPANMENFYKATRYNWHIQDLVDSLEDPNSEDKYDRSSRFARNIRVPGGAEKRQKYHANFDILAGGGLGR